MAVRDTNKDKKPFIVDRDEQTFIGIDFPFRVGQSGEGWGASTEVTLDAVTNNLRNLVSTEVGERLMQPNLGVRLKRFLFEPFSEELVAKIQDQIIEGMDYLLPFVQINDIRVKMSDNNTGDFRSVMEIFVDFSLKESNI